MAKKTTPAKSAAPATKKAATRKPAEKAKSAAPAAMAQAAAAKPTPTVKADVASVPAPPMPKVNRAPSHDEIAAKAHEIWVSKGYPSGQDEQNWREAEAALRG